MGNLSKIQILALSHNSLSGEIPSSLRRLTELQELYLNNNQLTGEIPTGFVRLSNLEELHLSNNMLTGCIPVGLSDVPLNDLDNLNLSFCDCSTGTAVPDPANNPGLVSDCEALLASRDTLAGTATLNWSADSPIEEWDGVGVGGSPERITELVLQWEMLNGEIPSELGSLSKLTLLDLAVNELTGGIPVQVVSLSNLQELKLLE